MRALTIVGIILVVLGIAGFVIQGITVTSTEEVADIGPLEIQEEQKETYPIPPIASGAAILVGVILAIVGARQR